MSQLIVTQNAVHSLERCRKFLKLKSPDAASNAAKIIKKYFLELEKNPNIGRPVGELRELLIPFGNSGYIALYKYDKSADYVYILAVKHQKEEKYS